MYLDLRSAKILNKKLSQNNNIRFIRKTKGVTQRVHFEFIFLYSNDTND